MWSPKRYFEGAKCTDWEVPNLLDVSDVGKGITFLSAAKKDHDATSLSHYFTSNEKQPEAIIAFVYKQLGTGSSGLLTGAYTDNTDKARLAFLKTTLEQSKSCLSVPFVDNSGASMTKAISKASTSFVSFDLGKMDCDALIAAISSKEHKKLLKNGVTDTILVKVDKVQELSPKCMSRFLKVIGSRTTNYVAMVASETSAQSITMSYDKEIRKLKEQPTTFNFGEVLKASNGTNTADLEQWASIVVGVPMALFMVLMFLIGTSCMMDIDTPVRFPNKNLQIAKEY
jgi:hypothetical protein